MGKEKQVPTKLETYVIDEKGNSVPLTKENEKKRAKEIGKVTKFDGNIDLLDMETKDISAKLKHQDNAIQTVLQEMVVGRHYIEIPNLGPYLTQDGADFLARATGISVSYELTEKTVMLDMDYIDFEYKAVGTVNGSKIGEAEASANSLEESHKKVFMKQEGDQWVKLPNKSVFDVLNTVKQKAQIRAKKKLVRNILGISAMVGQDPELAENPTANKHGQMSVYRLLYKYFLVHAPEAPAKKKLKNGKWKFFTDKEKLTWRKEWVRVNVLQPYLLENGMKTHEWGINDIEELKKIIPTLEVPKKEDSNESK